MCRQSKFNSDLLHDRANGSQNLSGSKAKNENRILFAFYGVGWFGIPVFSRCWRSTAPHIIIANVFGQAYES